MTTYKQQAINRDNFHKSVRKLTNKLWDKKMGRDEKEQDKKILQMADDIDNYGRFG